jgi:hypothetical protein
MKFIGWDLNAVDIAARRRVKASAQSKTDATSAAVIAEKRNGGFHAP